MFFLLGYLFLALVFIYIMTDKALILLLSKGDHTAFAVLYKEYYKMASYYILRNSGNEEDAQDIFQDALVVFYEKTLQDNFKLSCSIKTYLYAIIRNLWLKKIRDNKLSLAAKDFEQVIALEENNEVLIKEEKYNQIENALGQLGEKCREIIIKFYYYKKKMTEIAEELAYTNADNVKNQKYKCMQQLKKLVNHE